MGSGRLGERVRRYGTRARAAKEEGFIEQMRQITRNNSAGDR